MKRSHITPALPAGIPALALLAVGASALLVGCAGSRSAATRASSEPSAAITDRPLVAQSAAEIAPGGGSGQLDFFDELETHELVTQDDALHAVLLAFHGSSAPTYVQRAAIAKQLGLLNPYSNPQPREAVTAGEVSQLLSRGLNRDLSDAQTRTVRPTLTSQQALESMQNLGVLPTDWRTTRGMTGPELLAAINKVGHVAGEQRHADAGKE